MVVIKKGKKELTVTSNAYKNFYKNAGWIVKGEEAKAESNVQTSSDASKASDDEASDEEWADAMAEDEEPTKPLSEMNRAELEEMAKELGVSLAGLSTNKQIREAIKDAM